jgi:hypothetical protein
VTHTKDLCGKKRHQIRLQEFIYLFLKSTTYLDNSFSHQVTRILAGFLYFFYFPLYQIWLIPLVDVDDYITEKQQILAKRKILFQYSAKEKP